MNNRFRDRTEAGELLSEQLLGYFCHPQAIGAWYENFDQITDDRVCELLDVMRRSL